MPIRTESKYSKKDIFIHMKTTIDIPNKILAEVHLYSNRKSKKDAILTAMQEYVQKKKIIIFEEAYQKFCTSNKISKLKRLYF